MAEMLRPVRLISIAAFTIWLALTGIQYGYVATFQYAWGFNLLRYLPDGIGWVLSLGALLLTTEEARRGVIRVVSVVAGAARNLSPRALDAFLFATSLAALFLLREREIMGNTTLLNGVLGGDARLAYPETGAELLVRAVLRGAGALSLPLVTTGQFASCVFGAVTVVAVARAARTLAVKGGTSATALIPLLVFSGGIARALAGRLDVQPAALAATAVYLQFALSHLTAPGERSIRGPALALGVACWLQPLCLFLAPSLLVLAQRRKLAGALGWVALPLLLHTVYLVAFQPGEAVAPATLLTTLTGTDKWVRGWGGAAGRGTDYVLLTLPHLKYLANAVFVLAPAALPLLAGLAIARTRGLFAPPAGRFLAVAAASITLGAVLQRPIWGPFDWNLLAVPALVLGFTAGAFVAAIPTATVRAQLATAAIGLQLLLVGGPLVAIGIEQARPAGPFAPEKFQLRIARDDAPPPRRIAPWL